jgi:hypothetical protein
MDLRDQNNGCVRPCCWKTQFYTMVHERKLVLANPMMRYLFYFMCADFFLRPQLYWSQYVVFVCGNIGWREREGRIFRLIAKWMVACAKSNILLWERPRRYIKWKERERVHSPRMAYVDNKYRAIAFKRPHTPIFMSMFYAH